MFKEGPDGRRSTSIGAFHRPIPLPLLFVLLDHIYLGRAFRLGFALEAA